MTAKRGWATFDAAGRAPGGAGGAREVGERAREIGYRIVEDGPGRLSGEAGGPAGLDERTLPREIGIVQEGDGPVQVRLRVRLFPWSAPLARSVLRGELARLGASPATPASVSAEPLPPFARRALSAAAAVAATALVWGILGAVWTAQAARDALAGQGPSWYHAPSMAGALREAGWRDFAGAGWIYALAVGQALGFAIACLLLATERFRLLARRPGPLLHAAGLGLLAFLMSGAGTDFARSSLFSPSAILGCLATPWAAFLAYTIPWSRCARDNR